MKKFLILLVPVVLWILTLVVWNYSENFIDGKGLVAFWWVITNLLMVVVTFFASIITGTIFMDKLNK